MRQPRHNASPDNSAQRGGGSGKEPGALVSSGSHEAEGFGESNGTKGGQRRSRRATGSAVTVSTSTSGTAAAPDSAIRPTTPIRITPAVAALSAAVGSDERGGAVADLSATIAVRPPPVTAAANAADTRTSGWTVKIATAKPTNPSGTVTTHQRIR
ncbi:hypothetical protein SIM91_02320 [Rhodococcus opacus]|nr:hypothetical protein [Rhodococcus opacus]MDX5962176.1 hypothetical protein [Rhodococcus opacus]